MRTRLGAGAISTLALGVAVIAAPFRIHAQTPTAALVLGSPVITISYPATDEEAYQAADMAMSAAGVSFVLESSVRPADQPAFDFARPPDTRTTLTGLSLARALSEISRADNAFHYNLTGNVVVARFGAIPTPLDAPSTPLDLTGADASDVLTHIVGLLDPGAAESWHIQKGMTPAGAASAPPVNVHLRGGTVRDALVAVAASGPARSVRASYFWRGGQLAVSALDLRDGQTLSGARLAVAVAPDAMSGAQRLMISGGGLDLSFLVLSYTRSTGVPVGMEMLPMDIANARQAAPARIDVTGLPPAEALKRIVAYDSRYQLTQQDNGWFLVAPKVGVPGRPTILDTPLPPFVRRGESIDVVGSDLVARLGARNSSPTGNGAPSPSPALSPQERIALARRMQAAAAARTVTVEFPRETTGRAVLQAIAASAEATSWLLRGTSGSDGRISYQFTLQFPDGSSVGRSFVVESDLAASRPPAPAPHTLTATEVGMAIDQITRDSHVSVTAELVQPAGAQFDHPDTTLLARLRGQGVEAALTQLVALCDGCAWKKDHDVYRITSSHLPAREAWLDRKVDSFRHHFANIREAFDEIRKLGARSMPSGVSMGVRPVGPEERSFEVNLGRSTIRQVLDVIAAGAGSNRWAVVYTDANGTFPEVALQLWSVEGHHISGSIPIR